ncbi:uncharacterized protein [Onthophagus taurus]|uniref:uncharacterized protein n=1 Tax=Onthophagus taurus TaxID=166361 RepID=UPI0039BE60D1
MVSALLYKALIQSRLEFVTWLMLPVLVLVFKKLAGIQLQAARAITGAIRSTPTNALLVEANIMPLDLRLRLLMDKFVAKNLMRRSGSVGNLMENLSQLHRNGRVADSRVALIIKRYEPLLPRIVDMRRTNVLDMFRVDFEVYVHAPKVRTDLVCAKLRQTLPAVSFNYNAVFNREVQSSWPGAKFIFTDASVTGDPTKRVHFGVYAPDMELSHSGKLSDHANIFVAELFAVWWAMDYVKTNRVSPVVVFTDSLSVIRALEVAMGRKTKVHYLLNKVKELSWQCAVEELKIELVWITGHVGIVGNERADGRVTLVHGIRYARTLVTLSTN